MEEDRQENAQADLQKCTGIADELYKAGEDKVGTDEATFIKYFTSLSPPELILVCKEYHKKYKKNMLDVLKSEFDGNEKNLLIRAIKLIYFSMIILKKYIF